ncbi:hypothetical protein BGZ82_001122, partial [Podila clonocystis]
AMVRGQAAQASTGGQWSSVRASGNHGDLDRADVAQAKESDDDMSGEFELATSKSGDTPKNKDKDASEVVMPNFVGIDVKHVPLVFRGVRFVAQKKVFHVMVGFQFQKNETKGKIEVQQTLKEDDVMMELIRRILSGEIQYGDRFTLTGEYRYNMYRFGKKFVGVHIFVPTLPPSIIEATRESGYVQLEVPDHVQQVSNEKFKSVSSLRKDVIGKLPKWGNKDSSTPESLETKSPLAIQKSVEKWVSSVSAGKARTNMAMVLKEHEGEDVDRPIGLGLLNVGGRKGKSKTPRTKGKDSKPELERLSKEGDHYDFGLDTDVRTYIEANLDHALKSEDDAIRGYAELVQQAKEREQWILTEQDLIETENTRGLESSDNESVLVRKNVSARRDKHNPGLTRFDTKDTESATQDSSGGQKRKSSEALSGPRTRSSSLLPNLLMTETEEGHRRPGRLGSDIVASSQGTRRTRSSVMLATVGESDGGSDGSAFLEHGSVSKAIDLTQGSDKGGGLGNVEKDQRTISTMSLVQEMPRGKRVDVNRFISKKVKTGNSDIESESGVDGKDGKDEQSVDEVQEKRRGRPRKKKSLSKGKGKAKTGGASKDDKDMEKDSAEASGGDIPA